MHTGVYVSGCMYVYPHMIPQQRRNLQETRNQIFNDYVELGRKNTSQVEARFNLRLEECQRTQVRYGFRNDVWITKHHGEKKAPKIMQRKREMGLTLGFN